MGAADSRGRSVSFGLDAQDNVRVAAQLSGDVLQRMRESGPSSSSSSKPESAKPEAGPSAAETQEELRRRFEREQALVQEELARISRREREMAGDYMNPAALREKAKTRQEPDKTHNLVRDLIAIHSTDQLAVEPRMKMTVGAEEEEHGAQDEELRWMLKWMTVVCEGKEPFNQ
ncbi:MICOS complex subunit mic25a-like [Sinocyclocheilus grahami]|uniref:MICOS complex subunit mic25a-like n=1 Tax=Sinocyclocheilus grahami TaxID=75366 RepID=UPI0007AC6205|nr:PREDICTED: MICOS complex subunit mic25a-like [Sinocyclocheilus grahami]